MIGRRRAVRLVLMLKTVFSFSYVILFLYYKCGLNKTIRWTFLIIYQVKGFVYGLCQGWHLDIDCDVFTAYCWSSSLRR